MYTVVDMCGSKTLTLMKETKSELQCECYVCSQKVTFIKAAYNPRQLKEIRAALK